MKTKLTKSEVKEAKRLIRLMNAGVEMDDQRKAVIANYYAVLKTGAETRHKKAETKSIKKGGDTMKKAHLSPYDAARKQLKKDGVKTKQATTKASLTMSLLRSKNPAYVKLGKAIKAEAAA